MGWIKNLYAKTKDVARMYTGIFIAVMFLNQLLFFGLCLNPICLIAAMPHVLFITVLIGVWLHRPTWEKVKKTLIFVRLTYDEVKVLIEKNRKGGDSGGGELFTGNIYLFVTQNQSKGERDFQTVLDRHKKNKAISKIRVDNKDGAKALLRAINGVEQNFEAGDIIAIVRGGGDTKSPQFDSYRDVETCAKILRLAEKGLVTVSGVGHAGDDFPIQKAVNFAQITPTDAAYTVVFLISGQRWNSTAKVSPINYIIKKYRAIKRF